MPIGVVRALRPGPLEVLKRCLLDLLRHEQDRLQRPIVAVRRTRCGAERSRSDITGAAAACNAVQLALGEGWYSFTSSW
jgi:hypothetical protein